MSTFLRNDGTFASVAGSSGVGTVSSIATNNGITGGTITTTGTIGRALNEATATVSVGATTTFTNTASKQQAGFSSSFKIAPVYSSRVQATIYGYGSNATVNDQVIYQMSLGTTVSTFGGTAIGAVGPQIIATSATANASVPFSLTYISTSLTAGTTYCFDLQVAVNAGTGTVTAAGFTAFEF